MWRSQATLAGRLDLRLQVGDLLDVLDECYEPNLTQWPIPPLRQPLVPEPFLEERLRHDKFSSLGRASRTAFGTACDAEDLIDQVQLAFGHVRGEGVQWFRGRLAPHLCPAEIPQGKVGGVGGVKELAEEVVVDTGWSKGLSCGGVIVNEGAVVLDDVVFRQLMQIQLQ